MTLRFPPGHAPKTEDGGRRTLKSEFESVSSSIQAIADGYSDDILTENDSGYGNRVVLSSGPDFGDGPGLYIRIEDRWYKVIAVEIASAQPHGENEIFGVIQEVTNTTDIAPDVGALAFDALIQELEETFSGQITVQVQNGSMTTGSAAVNLDIETGQIQSGHNAVSGNFPVLQIISTSPRPITGIVLARGNAITGFSFSAPPPPPPPPGDFIIYPETNYKNQPNLLAQYGLEDMPFLYAQNLWPAGSDKDQLPPKDFVVNAVKNYAASRGGLVGKKLVLDIEHWNVQTSASDAQAIERRQKLITMLDWAKEGAPQSRVGYYGLPIVGGYYAVRTPGSDSYKRWQARNTLLKPIADKQQDMFPAYYALTDKVDEWKNVVTHYIMEAKRTGLNKPVYFVLNPRYSPAAFDSALRYDPFPYAFFKTQLEHLKARGAAGTVIWGADLNTTEWSLTQGTNPPHGWFKASLDFLAAQ